MGKPSYCGFATTEERDRAFLALWEEGKSAPQIAETIGNGATKSLVYSRARDLKFPTRVGQRHPGKQRLGLPPQHRGVRKPEAKKPIVLPTVGLFWNPTKEQLMRGK